MATSLQPLPGLDEALFIQARLGQVAEVASVASADQIGAVYTLRNRKGQPTTKRADVEAAVRMHRSRSRRPCRHPH